LLPRDVDLESWRTLLERAPALIAITVGPEHRYVFLNALARSTMGGSGDAVGKPAAEVSPDLRGSPLVGVLDEVYRTGRPWSGDEVRVPSTRGGGRQEERYFTFSCQPFRDAHGVAGVMTFGHEVTAAVRARRRLETMFDANLVGNVSCRLDGEITSANDAFLATVGYGRDDLEAGRISCRAMTPPEFAAADAAKLLELRERRVHPPYEKEYLRKDGSRVPVLVSAALFPDSDDEGIAYVVDLTAVKQAERRIRELLAEARAGSRAKDEFLAMLGHELRNPLAPIGSAIELLRLRGAGGPELDTLERQVGQISRLVDDLLDVARITHGEISIERRPVDLRRVVDRAVELAAPLVEARRHRLVVTVGERPPVVAGDETRLAQAVSNLLVNAARYTDAGGTIALDVGGEGGKATIAVRDDGQGIAPELLDSIFDLFVRGPGERASCSAGGLGLGLAIVRSLVRLHGGEVTASSAGPGRGSTFTITLPVAPVRRRDVPAAPARPPSLPGCGCSWWTTTPTPPTSSARSSRTTGTS
jgi:PAS domain S-box-containing protein